MDLIGYERVEKLQRVVYATLLLVLLYGAVVLATAPAYR
jgi:hypothetical protein